MDNINTFEINKTWFSYVAENINVKPIHTALYFFIFNKWNSLFWKKQFGLPTDNTMQCLNIRSYKTYINALNDLESFGFIKFIERSKNQNTSNVIEVVNNTKATTKATTKALLKATTQSDDQSDDQSGGQSGGQSNVSIDKQYNKEQLNLLTKNHIKVKEFLKTFTSSKKFFIPTIDQLNEYCSERKNSVDPQRFIDHYSSNGWMVGKNKMKDWKAAVRTWEKSNFNTTPKKQTSMAVSDFTNITKEDLIF